MNKLKRLQQRYADGKINEEAYQAAVADLLEDADLTQEEHDTALEYTPDDDSDEKLIYSQADMDGAIVKKARALVKKSLKDAGVDVADVKPQDLLTKVAELAAAGNGKAKETDSEVAELRRKAAAFDKLEPVNKSLTVENAVLKSAAKLNPINPAQVVRALNADYADLLEYDEETGALDPKSVAKALKRVADVEPNLFGKPEGGTDDNQQHQQADGTFSGKTPGGAGGGTTQAEKDAAKMATQKAKALDMLGIKTETK